MSMLMVMGEEFVPIFSTFLTRDNTFFLDIEMFSGK